jgi:cobalt/nickel transport system ATP-binding protein
VVGSVTAPLIEARNLAYGYPDGVVALAGLDITIPQGRRLAILGPNGSGKTTLLLHLAGLLRPDSGTLSLAGRPVGYGRADMKHWRQRVQMVLQEPDDQLFAASVAEDVSFGPINLGLDQPAVSARVDDALAALDLAAVANRPPHLLSYGQRKRVVIAGAVAMQPDLLLLDEPSAGLDGDGVSQLLAALARLQETGTTIAIATHDVDLAHGWADDVGVIVAGRVMRQGPARQLLADADVLAAARLRTPSVVRMLRALTLTGWELRGEDGIPGTIEGLAAGLERRACDRRPDSP